MRHPITKILDVEAAAAWRRQLLHAGKRLVMTNGCFDLLHRGHVEYLNAARALGDALAVAVNSDASVRALKGPARPVVPETDRAYMLASLEAVDAVVVFGTEMETDVCPLIERIRPDIYVKGGDYTIETINQDERRLLEKIGTRIRFLPLISGLSTTELIQRILRAHPQPGGAGAPSGRSGTE